VTVKLILRDKEYTIKSGMTLRDTLKKIQIEPDSVLAVIDGDLITDDQILKDQQEIKLIAVISGG
jgi:sulfur carrier protein ThiS